MKVTGRYQFASSPQKVWEALTDPELLAGCIPGCAGLRPLGEDEFEAGMTVGVGPVRGQYNAKISMRDKLPYRSFRLLIDGNGTTGFVHGEAQITLEPQDGGSTVVVDGDSQVGGTVARVGQRLMGSVARMLLDRFFDCLRQSVR